MFFIKFNSMNYVICAHQSISIEEEDIEYLFEHIKDELEKVREEIYSYLK